MKRIHDTTGITFTDSIRLKAVVLAYKCINIVLRSLAFMLYRKSRNPARILIFRTGSLGDSLCAIPTISAIKKKYPAAQIDILINPGKAKATLISIDQLLSPSVYNKAINYFGLTAKQTLSILRGQKYDLVVQLPQDGAPFFSLVRDMLFYRIIAKAGWGWEIGKVFFFRDVQEKYLQYDREVVRLAKIAARNHVIVDTEDFPLNITHEDHHFVQDTFIQSGITGRKIIGMCIGSKRPQNRWPLRNFMQVVTRFAADFNIVIIGGEEDREAAASLATTPHVFNLCGAFTPMQSAVAFTKCSIVLSNDTGPMHLSYAVGTPTAALFSSRDFKGAWFPPENGTNIVFRSENIHCALCLSHFCGDNICMQAISPSLVIAGMSGLITGSGNNSMKREKAFDS